MKGSTWVGIAISVVGLLAGVLGYDRYHHWGFIVVGVGLVIIGLAVIRSG